jgi:soluble lytic murein transglycosylase-like protein
VKKQSCKALSPSALGALMPAFFLGIILSAAPATADMYAFRGEGGALYYTNIPGQDRCRVRMPLKEKRAAAPKAGMPRPPAPGFTESSVDGVIASVGELFAVDPDLIRAIIRAESNFDPRAVSPKGASGLMQLMPQTALDMGVRNPFDPEENIFGGVKYLRGLLDTLHGSLPLALAAYNAGPARVIGQNRIPAIPETRDYVERVLKRYHDLKRSI